MAEGTLTAEEFARNILDFLQVSDCLKDGWELGQKKNQSRDGCPFLVKRNVLRTFHITDVSLPDHSRTEEVRVDETATNIVEEDDVEDVGLKAPDGLTGATVCRFDYNIIYHPSYSVPTLYFSACHEDGKLLSLEEVWQSVPSHYEKRLESERWAFITQQEHPILGRPFYCLHPCHTADLMKAVQKSSCTTPTKYRNYVVTWLSSVAPVVGLSLPLAYAKLCEET